MPWLVNAELPDHVKGALPVAAQTRFRVTANDVLAKGGSERVATQEGWAAVGKGWQKTKDGKWVRKTLQTLPPFVYRDTRKAAPRTLYVCRYVKNGKDIVAWAKAQGFEQTLAPSEMHVTIAYSKQPVDWMKVKEDFGGPGGSNGELTVGPGGPRLVEPLGDKGAVVLLFTSDSLAWRNKAIQDAGASWDHPGYQPHITITWQNPGVDLAEVEPYTGKIVLGPEIFKEIKEDWQDSVVEKHYVDLLEVSWTASSTDSRKANPYPRQRGGKFGFKNGGGEQSITPLNMRTKGRLLTEDEISYAQHRMADPEFQDRITHSVTKEVTRAMLAAGAEVVVSTLLAWGVRSLVPMIFGEKPKSGPQTASRASAALVVNAVASTILGRVSNAAGEASGVLMQQFISPAINGAIKNLVSSSHADRAVGLAEKIVERVTGVKKSDDSVDELDVTIHALQELEKLFKTAPTSELAMQRAERMLERQYPDIYKELMKALKQAGVDSASISKSEEAVDQIDCRVAKVDNSLGLVFGYAIICKKDGKDYFDLNIDHNGERVPEHIPEAAMLESAIDFAENSRVATDMHKEGNIGTIPFVFPLTSEIAKALDLNAKQTGLLIAMKPNKTILAKFASGEYTGFSIGGTKKKVQEIKS